MVPAVEEGIRSSQPHKHNRHFLPEGIAQPTYLFIERLTRETNPAFNVMFQSADVCFWLLFFFCGQWMLEYRLFWARGVLIQRCA